MTNIAPNQDTRNPYKCRKCGRTIFWHKAQSGKHYPTDSPTDRRAFHQCGAGPAEQPAKTPVPAATPKPVAAPITPSYFSPDLSIEDRVAHLEQTVNNLIRTVKAVESRQPITAEDVGF